MEHERRMDSSPKSGGGRRPTSEDTCSTFLKRDGTWTVLEFAKKRDKHEELMQSRVRKITGTVKLSKGQATKLCALSESVLLEAFDVKVR